MSTSAKNATMGEGIKMELNDKDAGFVEACSQIKDWISEAHQKIQDEEAHKVLDWIWGQVKNGTIQPASGPIISATCIRVPTTDGHMAAVKVKFKKNPTKAQILKSVADFNNPLAGLGLPSAPKRLIHYFSQADRPQTALDRDIEKGMAIAMGRLRPAEDGAWKFIALSHNTIRGAAGGAILMAELLVKKGYISKK